MADTKETGDMVPLADAEVNNAEPAKDPSGSAESPPEPANEKPSEPPADQLDTATKNPCSCRCFLRALLFIISVPILLVVFLVGLVLWIVLIPLKCLCPCCAPCLQALADFVVFLVKLPLKFLRWVSGKTEDSAEEKSAVNMEEGKTNYGATADDGLPPKDGAQPPNDGAPTQQTTETQGAAPEQKEEEKSKAEDQK